MAIAGCLTLMLNPLVKIKMKQIDKLAWIEIKDKKYFQPEALERTNTIFLVGKRSE
jgi:hypothetical protein